MANAELEKILPTLKKRQWYNQRFDGSPLFLFYMGSSDVKSEHRKPKGTNGEMGICFFSHGKADWYFALDDIQSGAQHMIAAAKKDPKISKHLLKKWKKDEQTFESFFLHKFPNISLKKLNNHQLYQLLEKLYLLFTKATSSTSIIDRFALGTDELIGSMIRKEIFSKKKKYRESEFVRLFSVLTAPVHQSFINQAEIDLLTIAQNPSSKKISEYQSKYFWIHNNYVSANVLTVDYFAKQIQAWKKLKKNLNFEIKKIQQTPPINKRRKRDFLKKNKISPLLKTLISISEDFTWWQDQRKKFTYLNIHMGSQILKEISRRTRYGTEELKYTLLGEIKTIIESDLPSRSLLQKRIRNSAFILTPAKSIICEGKETERLRKTLFAHASKSGVRDFRGLSACTGRAIGRVRILKSAKQIKTMKQGEVLVAVMTRPDYIPAMKKAAAIITNEGGVTSHAAIVSRELGIPCIIGTKIATEVLKNGDMVEINANHGWIKKIS